MNCILSRLSKGKTDTLLDCMRDCVVSTVLELSNPSAGTGKYVNFIDGLV